MTTSDDVSAVPANGKATIVTDFGTFIIGDKVGVGAHAKVYKALHTETGHFVAVKKFDLSGTDTNASLPPIRKEVELMRTLNHEKILKVFGCFEDHPDIYLFLEYAENGSLAALLKEFTVLPEPAVALYMEQVLLALIYLHGMGIVHRDIKAGNILLTQSGVKLADFGVATVLDGHRNTFTQIGSPYWMAPEVITECGHNCVSDVWSYGCTIVELLTGRPPFFEFNNVHALFKIVQSPIPIPTGITPECKDLLQHCFEKNPERRPTTAILITHPWFSKEPKERIEAVNKLNRAKAVADAKPTYAPPTPESKVARASLPVASPATLTSAAAPAAAAAATPDSAPSAAPATPGTDEDSSDDFDSFSDEEEDDSGSSSSSSSSFPPSPAPVAAASAATAVAKPEKEGHHSRPHSPTAQLTASAPQLTASAPQLTPTAATAAPHTHTRSPSNPEAMLPDIKSDSPAALLALSAEAKQRRPSFSSVFSLKKLELGRETSCMNLTTGGTGGAATPPSQLPPPAIALTPPSDGSLRKRKGNPAARLSKSLLSAPSPPASPRFSLAVGDEEMTKLRHCLASTLHSATGSQKALKQGFINFMEPRVLEPPDNLKIWSMLAAFGCVWLGCSEGIVCVWKADASEFLTSFKVHKTRILSLVVVEEAIWMSSEEAEIYILSLRLFRYKKVPAHDSQHKIIKTLLTVKKGKRVKSVWSCAPLPLSSQVSILNKAGRVSYSVTFPQLVTTMEYLNKTVWLGCFSTVIAANWKTGQQVREVQLNMPGQVNSMAVVGDYIVVAHGAAGIQVFAADGSEVGAVTQDNDNLRRVVCLFLFQNVVLSADADGAIVCYDPVRRFNKMGRLSFADYQSVKVLTATMWNDTPHIWAAAVDNRLCVWRSVSIPPLHRDTKE
eukprot:TRINITY_DN1166_c0_g1_i3.p1 TRINITY_DN1166_c0_g1~~TRINITY_DN1166_c0_g1_i3.p1  ORF type:complete len:898 (+),score=255.10 TRINITY_DN1166_c0_g1_i3:33-2726(+)